MNLWSPAFWNDASVVSLTILVAVLFLVSIARGWLVPGSQYKEIVRIKDEVIKNIQSDSRHHRDRAEKLIEALASKSAAEEANMRLLQSLREAVERGQSGSGVGTG